MENFNQNFVFIIFELNDIGLLTIENAYFGRLSYNEFKLKCKNGMRISENMVKELCVKIIWKLYNEHNLEVCKESIEEVTELVCNEMTI